MHTHIRPHAPTDTQTRARAHARMFTQTRSQFARSGLNLDSVRGVCVCVCVPVRLSVSVCACVIYTPKYPRRKPRVCAGVCVHIAVTRISLSHAAYASSLRRMLATVGGLDSSGVACWGGASSGDEWGGRRQVGTASHVNRGRSFVWLRIRVSVWMPASDVCSIHSMQTFVGCNSRIVRFRTGV